MNRIAVESVGPIVWLRRAAMAGLSALVLAGWLLGGVASAAGPAEVTNSQTMVAAGADPNFDGVFYQTLGCGSDGDPQGDENPGAIDMVGDAGFPAVFFAHDLEYLYFRFRVDADPSGPNGFAQYSWVALMQVPTGNPFQYQYELALDGAGAPDDFGNAGGQKGDTIEIWRNDPAEDMDFSPLFNDPAEIRRYAQRYDFASAATENTTPLARISVAPGSSFGGTPDYFVEFAVPVTALIASGAIASAADLDDCLFFPAVSADSNQYNKDHLACPFLPQTTLSIDKTASPAALLANTATPLTYSIVVTNQGQKVAKGVVIEDPAVPTYMSNVAASCSSADVTVTCSVASTNPLQVRVPKLPAGSSLTVTIVADASPTCSTSQSDNEATAFASNAEQVSDRAVVTVGGSTEICDGKDNDCDGLVDEDADICSDGNVCDGAEQCVSGTCRPGTPLSCDDGNVCTDDSCDPATGCIRTNNTAPCNDGNACTTNDTCAGGACVGGAAPNCDDGNVCTTDTCIPASGCSHANNAVPCDDGNACTTNDTCSGGRCVGGVAPNCDDGNPCTTDTCIPASGCSHANNTAPCDDGSACTTNDTCSGGACVGGAPPNCDDGNVCTTDTCIPASGCSHASNTLPCNDGNACTTNDTCAGGACVGGAPPNCDDGSVCTTDTCIPASGCSHADNTAPCDDGNACTTNDRCSGRACVGGAPSNCDDGNACTDDGCDPSTGCVHANNADPCDDGNACTTNDTCSGGRCVGGVAPNCDDGNVCTNDTCVPASGCSHANNRAPCNDANACTTNDTCSGGACVGGAAPNCDDGNPCTTDSCDPSTGCVHTNNTAPCDDGNACTTNDTCSGGSCVGGAPPNCDDGNVCTNDTCIPASGCSHTNNTAPCNDGNACTTNDTCSGGACVGGAAPNCDDGNVCTSDSCTPASGCSHAYNRAPCDDGNACSTNDTCSGGVCVGGAAPNCDDGNVCTTDSCDPSTGCVHAKNTAPCNDGNACTTNDTCSGGACVGGAAPDCNDGNVCTTDTCMPASGCSHANNTAPCNDGNACTTNDTCSGGACVGGAAPNCDDGNVCTTDTCTPASGCSHANNTAPCNDGSACTTNDACSGGRCVGGAAPNCDDGNPCTTDSCDPSIGCVHANNTAPCDDGNACTTNDTCSGGECVGGAAPSCDDGNVCTNDTCDPTRGCVHTNNSAPCNDGNACTTSDTCSGGRCVGGAAPNCDDGNACTTDTCVPASGCAHTNHTAPCNDGNACTTNDVCLGGACVGGPAPNCNDGNVCTDDTCDPARGCVHTNNSAPCDDGFICTTGDFCSGGACVGGPPLTPDCKEPKTVGFYKRLCMGPHPEDALTQANADCVNDTATFRSVDSVQDVCSILYPEPQNDKCEQAESQFMATMLNLCKGRVYGPQPIQSACTPNTTAGQSIREADALLSNAARQRSDCVRAQCESEEINSGAALRTDTLRVSRTPDGVLLSWAAPPSSPGWPAPLGYRLWRRPHGTGAFTPLADVTGLSYEDRNQTDPADYDYEMTPIRP